MKTCAAPCSLVFVGIDRDPSRRSRTLNPRPETAACVTQRALPILPHLCRSGVRGDHLHPLDTTHIRLLCAARSSKFGGLGLYRNWRQMRSGDDSLRQAHGGIQTAK